MPLQMISKFKKMIKGHYILCYVCISFIVVILIKDLVIGREALLLPDSMTELEEDDMVAVEGVVYKIQEKDYGQQIYLENATHKWLVYDYDFQEVYLGNTVQVQGELILFDSPRNFGNFDSLTYYNTLGIVAAVSASEILITDEDVFFVQNYLYEIRLAGIERIYEILGVEEGSLLVAMIFGEKDDMDDEQEELYQKIGISHIFAISGLHISLLSLVVYQLIRKGTGSFLLAGIISSIFLALYILMIGMGISAIRAGTMFLIRVGADISGRVYDIRTSLAFAALCIIVPNSAYIYYSGFLLSFGAILGVIYLLPFWEEFLDQWSTRNGLKDHKIACWAIQGIGASLGIQLMILPILLYSYYEVSPYSLVINLLVIPMMTILLGVAMIGILLSLIWYGGGALLISFSGWVLQAIDLLGEMFLALPFSRLVVGKPWFLMIIIYYIGIFLAIVYLYIGKKADVEEEAHVKMQKHMAVFFCLLPILLTLHLPASDLQVTMLDIGQGDCLYIRGPDGIDYLVDGGSTDISSVGKYRIETYLRALGVDAVEYVFISHGDSDHMNGIEEMLMRQDLGVRIDTLVFCGEDFHDEAMIELMEVARSNGTVVAIMEEGDQIVEGDLVLTYLAPLSTYDGELGNESSMVLELSIGDFQMLFTGDVEGQGEEELIEILEERIEETGVSYEVLKVSHHGSKNSTPDEFLNLVSPQVAFISAGIDSIYGHPHEELLERLESANALIYATPDYGGVTLSYNVNDDTINIKGTVDVGD